MSGLLIAAPASGSGKTTVTLGLLRALRRRGVAIAPAKAGPDYIDPAFHEAASGRPCVNLDPWAMRPALLATLASEAAEKADAFVVEGMMGLFDGAADGSGSAADLAALLGLDVILVVDCARQSHSIAALVRGFRDHRPEVSIAGVILNRVASPRHAMLLREALAPIGMRALGVLPPRADLALPERHLGLVQAGEHTGLEDFIERAADWAADGLDLDRLAGLARPGETTRATAARLPPLAARIAVARDEAFAFAYPHILSGWRAESAALSFFSPLADEAPDPAADAVFLPGGYPELHAGRLAAASCFIAGMRQAADRGVAVYGECGGYMVLGEAIEDADGCSHAMLGLLPVETSFRQRKRHLGYRRIRALSGFPWGGTLRGHEFHYSTVVREGPGEPLFEAEDARGEPLEHCGLRVGNVAGSYLHVIDRTEP
ncbi:cobyrinate a,c-diamide synthase [Consotaella salsifontis]|uniref:Hydrogenobyrinate a,c-diamide synthase n=1 Tax=Consotaella salsifontis TaxID=1365950 RepID=A0A1T4SJB4_9HYPH|nr:cobyrinate a,c-diamide synthase [Consotaella salsifontis]SKA28255.1 hydrogenobyrinic acid a,c-diamide synthase (glutamine-hydrolysing) /cobyrinate a,c-diamide synthase [Consotaella salsifontis]